MGRASSCLAPAAFAPKMCGFWVLAQYVMQLDSSSNQTELKESIRPSLLQTEL